MRGFGKVMDRAGSRRVQAVGARAAVRCACSVEVVCLRKAVLAGAVVRPIVEY